MLSADHLEKREMTSRGGLAVTESDAAVITLLECCNVVKSFVSGSLRCGVVVIRCERGDAYGSQQAESRLAVGSGSVSATGILSLQSRLDAACVTHCIQLRPKEVACFDCAESG